MFKYFAIRKCLLMCIVITQSICSIAQEDFEWWNNRHNWDGVTHWSEYIIMSADYMGPNALPVPILKNGVIEKDFRLEFAIDAHFSKGDNTQNLFLDLFIPIVSKKVGFHLNVVPFEHYEMSSTVRDERKARDFDGEGYSGGDIYVGTQIQVLKDRKGLPDIMISMNLKTASGTNLAAARYTDMAGYYFDASFGKKKARENSLINFFHPYMEVGFFAWQTNMDNNPQNDAFLYGIGCGLGIRKVEVNNSFAGYMGYLNNGDRPIVYRMKINTVREKKWNYQFMFQQGINDFDYSSFRFSIIYKFPFNGL